MGQQARSPRQSSRLLNQARYGVVPVEKGLFRVSFSLGLYHPISKRSRFDTLWHTVL